MSAPPPPQSRRERKKRETRARILEAALALMAERGYDAVKIEDVAARADVANATFFLHFPTKSALIVAFNEQVCDKIAERLEGFSLGAVEKLELLRAIVLDEWSRRAALLRKLVAEAAAENGAAVLESSSNLVALVEAIVAEGQSAGELSAEFSPETVAQCLVSAWRAATVKWAVTGDDHGARRANREALDLVLKGALPR